MRISINSAVEIDYTEVGYGNAISNIYQSLKRLKHSVSINDATAPLQLNWMQPHLFRPNRFQYQILYFPWESTEFRTGWRDICNRDTVDEVWTTTEWTKSIFEKEGVQKAEPINVFGHGISSDWTPKLRKRNGPVKYLIVDAEANRKGYQEAFDAFRAVHGNDPRRATLTIKTRQRCMARWFDGDGRVRSPGEIPNVNINISRLSNEEMVKLFQDHDVLIYPSKGEGWGFIPQQMLATGGITITTAEWAPYKHYLGDLALKSSYGHTSYEGEHPGDICYPDQKHLEELVRLSYDDYENQTEKFFAQSFDVHEEYSWDSLTKKAFERVLQRFG